MSRTPEAFEEDQPQFKASQPPRSLNPLGQWAEDFRIPRGWTITKMGERFNLPSLIHFKNIPPEDTSIFTINHTFEQAVINGATEEELSLLRDVREKIIARTLEKKGKLYDRIPPSVPRRISRQLPYTTYTDSQLARNIDPRVTKRKNPRRAHMVWRIRTDFGFPTVFTEEQAQQIKDEITARDRRRAEKSMVKNEFALETAKILGKDPAVFKECPWMINRKIPDSEEFGAMLEVVDITDEQREKMINYWLDKYRETINLEMLGKEYGLTRARMHQIKKRLGYKGINLSWKAVEEIREYKSQSAEEISRTGIIPRNR